MNRTDTFQGVENLTDMVWANAERFGDTVSLRRRAEDSWLDVTARELAAQVLGVAKGLIATGVRPGDRVGPLPAAEWPVLDFAVWAAGGVTAPAGDTPAGVTELIELGAEIPDEQVHARRRAVGADDVAMLRPSGEPVTHGAVLAEMRATIAGYPAVLGPGNTMLIHLPLTHWFARVMSLSCVHTRTTVGHSAKVGDVGTFRPTAVVTEPRLLEQVYAAAKMRAHAEDRDRLFATAAAVAVDYSTAKASGGPSVALRGKHLMASRFLYPKLRVALGGRCTAVVSVGGQLDERLEHFFHGIGIPVHSA